MELKLSQAIYQAYQTRGIELTPKEVDYKLNDFIDYSIEGTIPDMVAEEIL
jgi:hypothetical protein